MFHFVMTSVMLLQTFLISIYCMSPYTHNRHMASEQIMSCGREKFGSQKTENSHFFRSMYSLIFSKRPITLDSTLSIHQGVRLGQRGISAKRKGQTTEFVFVA